MSLHESTRITVVGAGFGGLALAIRLQARGYRVTLLEKRERVGGRAYQLRRDGYTFDMGPSLITAPDIIGRVFRSAGTSTDQFLDLVPLDPFYRIYFHDGTWFDYSGSAARVKAEMAKFDRADAAAYDAFMAAVKPIYEAVIEEGLGSVPFDRLATMSKLLPRALKLGGLSSVYRFAAKYFRHPNNRFAFSFHPLFIGGSPFRTPGLYIMIPYLERAGGVWYARGGMYSLVEAFERLFRDLGGIIHTNAEVSEILLDHGRAVGVKVNGLDLRSDAVVWNGDVSHLYRNLIPAAYRRRWTNRRLDRLHHSMSCFLLYLGVRRQYPQLLHHTIILSHRYRELVEDIFDRKVLANDFSLYLHVPTRTDPTMAPEGCESMYVLAPVPHLGGEIDWSVEAERMKNRMLEHLEVHSGLKGLRRHLEVCEIFTPVDFATQLGSYLGNAFSLEPRLTQSAYFRPHNRSEEVRGLYIVGAGTHPGGGVPGVLLSAEATERCIVEDLGDAQPLQFYQSHIPGREVIA
ncbi:MAG TPA: phytoene desaturase family protein [Bacteroidota bacterium]|nr:phytoene desaturase family protein [Bacteroidota bacterium]